MRISWPDKEKGEEHFRPREQHVQRPGEEKKLARLRSRKAGVTGTRCEGKMGRSALRGGRGGSHRLVVLVRSVGSTERARGSRRRFLHEGILGGQGWDS